MQLVRVEMKNEGGRQRRQPQRAREWFLLDGRERLDRRAVTDVLRHVRVLTQKQQILDREAEQQRQAAGAKHRCRPEPAR